MRFVCIFLMTAIILQVACALPTARADSSYASSTLMTKRVGMSAIEDALINAHTASGARLPWWRHIINFFKTLVTPDPEAQKLSYRERKLRLLFRILGEEESGPVTNLNARIQTRLKHEELIRFERKLNILQLKLSAYSHMNRALLTEDINEKFVALDRELIPKSKKAVLELDTQFEITGDRGSRITEDYFNDEEKYLEAFETMFDIWFSITLIDQGIKEENEFPSSHLDEKVIADIINYVEVMIDDFGAWVERERYPLAYYQAALVAVSRALDQFYKEPNAEQGTLSKHQGSDSLTFENSTHVHREFTRSAVANFSQLFDYIDDHLNKLDAHTNSSPDVPVLILDMKEIRAAMSFLEDQLRMDAEHGDFPENMERQYLVIKDNLVRVLNQVTKSLEEIYHVNPGARLSGEKRWAVWDDASGIALIERLPGIRREERIREKREFSPRRAQVYNTIRAAGISV